MNLKEIYEEVVGHGWENIANEEGGEARIKRWINQAYREILNYRAWGFLEEEDEGKAPLTIEDLGHVLSVVCVEQETRLEYTTRAGLIHWDPTLSNSGIPTQWYLETDTELHVYPVNTDLKIKVRYLKEPADLKEDGDEPVMPEAWHQLIVDGAVVRAYKTTDNFEAAGFMRQEFDRVLADMVKTLRKSYDGNKLIQRTGSVNDYL